MKIKKISLFPIFLLMIMFTIACRQISVVYAPDGAQLMENVAISVNCTDAQLHITSMVTSIGDLLVHFPTGVDMNDPDLENATIISAVFSTDGSFLGYLFNNTDPTTATTIANSITSSMSTAFNTVFTYLSTGTYETFTNVTYTGLGKTNLRSYTEWLMTECLASDIGGFSLTFPPMSMAPHAVVVVSAMKDSGGFDWTYSMMVGYYTSITPGSGNHTIDVLYLLNVESLAPSSYASEVETDYTSMVSLTIYSNQTINYVSCEPGIASPPEQLRGWYIIIPSGTYLTAYFSFGNAPSPVSPLTFTFSGLVVPEFTTLALLALFTLAAAIVTILKKRFLK
ncbi:MAG: hypothetical protein ACUVTB_01810 [Candidatus Bathycorpusculaceae bacterium]